MELLGMGVILNGNDLCNNNIACVSAVMEHLLHLCGGKCESVNQRINIEAVKVNEIAYPVH